MRRWRRLAVLGPHFVATWLTAVGVATRCQPRRRQAIARDLAGQTLRLLGVRVRVEGALPGPGSALLVANHVSWLDVYAINSLLRARFIAKREVRDWPLIGRLVAAFDTFFIVRGSFRDAHRVMTRVTDVLRDGDRVVVFPEATTSDGSVVKPFHGALFQAAIDAGVPVQPVAIRYTDAAGRPTTAAAFVDDMTFAASLHAIAGAPSLSVTLTFGSPVAPTAGRRDVATATQAWIAGTLGVAALPPPARRRTPPVRRAA